MADSRWTAFGKLWGGGALLLTAAFMFLGFLVSGAYEGIETILGLIVAVGIPAGAGAALVASRFRARGRLTSRQEALRIQTIEAEVIRLASRREGRITVVEVAGELGVPAGEAKDVLDGLMAREVADIEVTESGVLVYSFHDVEHLEDKSSARPLLDPGPDRGFDVGGAPRESGP